ncbi:uncharacterized protein LOC109829116 [Asparagus officinalis]|uniref:uncharacterized protein LOC109829116 n=1 Tax=Asparagus officinalis TaxID=4686 RepID=UPI00098E647F|nr:uncharacterized protein LOC109829116 [Asparagus officinalis]
MEEELSMIEKNKTWELIERPEGRKVIGVKWVFRTKLNADSSINKYKIRYNQVVVGSISTRGLESVSTRCQISFFEWRIAGGDIH